jgi:glycosyltransferase involved in cell wall biosynthesis
VRVLVLITSPERRGAQVEAARLVDDLMERGLDTELAALVGSAHGATLDAQVLGNRPLSPSTLRSLRSMASEFDVTVAFGSTTLPACALGLLGSGSLFVYRSIGDPRAWSRGWLHRQRTGVLMRRAARVVALWDGAAAAICEMYGVHPDRVSVIPNGRAVDAYVPCDAMTRQRARERLGVPIHAVVVAAIGALTAEKRMSLALDAVSCDANLHLVVAGDGPERAVLEARAARLLGDRAVFLGSVDDVLPLYAACDVVLMTSRTEGMPGVAIEASLCGVPVVSTDVGAVSEIVVDGLTGVITEGEPSALSAGIATALTHRESFGAAARQRATEHFDSGAIAERWVAELMAVTP